MSGGHNSGDFPDGCVDRNNNPRGTRTRILKKCFEFILTFMIHATVAIFLVGNVIDIFIDLSSPQTLNFSGPSIGMSIKNPSTPPLGLGLPLCGWSLHIKSLFVACIAVIIVVIAFRRRSANGRAQVWCVARAGATSRCPKS